MDEFFDTDSITINLTLPYPSSGQARCLIITEKATHMTLTRKMRGEGDENAFGGSFDIWGWTT